MNAPALAVLNAIPRLEGNPYVICGERIGRHLVNLEKPWRRIRKAAKLDDVRLHDLRHSFASVAASGGQSLVVIGRQDARSLPACYNGALCQSCRRSSESGEQCRRQAHCYSNGWRQARRGCPAHENHPLVLPEFAIFANCRDRRPRTELESKRAARVAPEPRVSLPRDHPCGGAAEIRCGQVFAQSPIRFRRWTRSVYQY